MGNTVSKKTKKSNIYWDDLRSTKYRFKRGFLMLVGLGFENKFNMFNRTSKLRITFSGLTSVFLNPLVYYPPSINGFRNIPRQVGSLAKVIKPKSPTRCFF